MGSSLNYLHLQGKIAEVGGSEVGGSRGLPFSN